MSDFNLRRLVHHVAETTTLSDPRDIAAKVAEMVPREHRAAALSEALPVYVLRALSQERMLSPIKSAETGSAKVAAVRDDWARRLAVPLSVAGIWKRFGECTVEDLRIVAADLRAVATKAAAKADYYDAVADALPAGARVDSLQTDPTAVAE